MMSYLKTHCSHIPPSLPNFQFKPRINIYCRDESGNPVEGARITSDFFDGGVTSALGATCSGPCLEVRGVRLSIGFTVGCSAEGYQPVSGLYVPVECSYQQQIVDIEMKVKES